jgi:phosphate/sulfate permease
MRTTIVCGIATAALGAALAIGLSTHAQALAPANYSRALTETVASDAVVEKAVTAVGVAHRSARRTARRVHRHY